MEAIETLFSVVTADIENLVSHYFELLAVLRFFFSGYFLGGPGGFVFYFVAFLRLLRVAENSLPVLKIGIALLEFVTNKFET